MTRERVITALDCCIKGVNCPECPYYEHDNCSDTMIADACYFITNSEDKTDLQHELKALQSEFQLVTEKHHKAEIEKEQLQKEIAKNTNNLSYLKGKIDAYELCLGVKK